MAEFQKIMKKENDQFCVRSNHWGNSEKEAFLPVGEAVGLVRVSPHMSQFLVVAVGLFGCKFKFVEQWHDFGRLRVALRADAR